MNDKNFKVILYADNTNFSSWISYFSPLIHRKRAILKWYPSISARNLNDINELLSVNKLSLNIEITKNILFNYHQRHICNIIPNIVIGSEPIDVLSSTAWCWPLMNTWTGTHTLKISNKVSRILGVMCRLKAICLFTFSDFYLTFLFYHIYKMEFLRGVSK